VEVRDISSVIDADGWIGMDVFSRFLVTLDYPWRKLTLEPLPPYPDNTATPTTLNTEQETPAENSEAASASGTAQDAKLPESTASSGPHDRYIAPEMKNWDTVYRVGPTMIVPTVLNNKRMRLFVLETGSALTYISPSAASEVTNVRSANPGSLRPLPPAAQIHTGDRIGFRFAHLQQEKENVLSFDTSPISKRLGTEISGMFGFDLLGLLVMRIDYRDGLMSFEYSADRGYQHIR
jgi:hypothetical protein